MGKAAYTREELYAMDGQRTFHGDAREAAFLLGGIGTGNVSVGARGELRDWEIFNRPGKKDRLDYTFFALYAQEEGGKPLARVLESRLVAPFSDPFGLSPSAMTGLPRFHGSEMKGEYPFLNIDFIDGSLPVKVSLEAFTPLIPLNPDDSGIPCAIFRYRVKNTAGKPVNVSVAGSLFNAVGYVGADKFGWPHGHFGGNTNEFRQDNGLSGLYLYSKDFKPGYLRYGSMALATPEQDVTCKPRWLEGGWWDGGHNFWDDFSADGRLEPAAYGSNVVNATPENPTPRPGIGSLCASHRLNPGEEKVFTFYLGWYFPNRLRMWDGQEKATDDSPVVRNRFAARFADAWEAVSYMHGNLKRLEEDTRKFHSALFSSTLPDYVIDAVASNITVLRSPTCIWLENGTMIAWEGCGDKSGCCSGTCTHVWNYAQTIAFLFPTLEQSMRNVEFNLETDGTGHMSFRTHQVLELPRWQYHPAADGQMGTVIRLYREWKLSGDGEFLKRMWEGTKRALEFAFEYWDSDGDCVLDSQQHNTYDIEFYGPNSLTNSMFFAALKAGAEIAEALGDGALAERWRAALQKGSRRMDELLWSGEYYVQKIEDVNKYKYQYGEGCLSDQLLGQMMAHVAGLGYVLPEEHVKKAIHAVFRHNFLTDFTNHENVQRTYVLNGEKGLLLCSWPHGGRPAFPFVYSDEVWTGIEYQVAAHLIYEGFVDEGLSIVKAIRDRHDGYRRNPWNEVECGHHYARSMASWAVLTALTGFRCDMVSKVVRFAPKINQGSFKAFWSTGTAWGTYRQTVNEKTGKLDYSVDVLYGSLDGVKVEVAK